MNNQADTHYKPILDALNGNLPPGAFQLHIPAKAFQGMEKHAIKKIHDVIIGWIKQTAPTLPINPYAHYKGGGTGPTTLADVPFDVSLYRFKAAQLQGHLNIIHLVAEDGGKARTARIRTACDKKFPKLAHWKRDEGARTVLILEDNDIQLTNHQIVADVFAPLALARDDRPDETYVVITCTDPWWIWPILIDGRTCYEMFENGESPGCEVNMKELVQLTKR